MADETLRSDPFSQHTRPHQRPNLPPEEPTRHHMPPVVVSPPSPPPAAEVVSHVPSRAKRTKKGSGLRLPLGLMGVGVAGLVAVIIVGFFSFFGLYEINGWVYPGVNVGDIGLSGMTTSEAEAVLTAAWETGDAITLTDGTRTWQAAPADFGFTIDAQATVNRAFEQRGPLTFIESVTGSTLLEPVVTIDAQAAEIALQAWADTIVDVPPQNASIRIEGGQVRAVPSEHGLALDVDATLAQLSDNPGQALLGGTLTLSTAPVEPAITDAEPFIAEAQAMLAQPLMLSAYDPIADERVEQPIPPEEVAQWLTITETPRGPQIGVSSPALDSTLAQLEAQLGAERGLDASFDDEAIMAALTGDHRVTLGVTYNPTTYTVVSGDTLYRVAWKTGMPYWRILEANPGIEDRGLDVGDIVNIPPKTDLIPLPVVEGKRVRVSISEQRMWVYEDGQQIREFIISTGIADSPTQPGIFQMQTFDEWAYASNWDLYMPEFIGIYEAWPGFMNGFHGLPTLSGGGILWADVLGSPASYGCIILDLPDSEWLWNWSEEGIIVEIVE